ncbi:hypothetical protein BC831DRAFT_472480 [Entophlyctis helioformis]|nr:hypothetical protein BC831DRAFT_472480 [Entophlyctis helioformis]
MSSKTFAVFLVLFTISLGFSIYATVTPDFLRIKTGPLFGPSSMLTFGLFESCECSLFADALPKNPNADDLSLCQTFLTARWLEVSALGFGAVAWLGWLLLVSNVIHPIAVGLSFWCTGIHAVSQVLVNYLVIRRRDDALFYIGGDYGFSHTFVMVSWVLDVFLLAGLALSLWLRGSTVYIMRPHASYYYVAVPSAPVPAPAPHA